MHMHYCGHDIQIQSVIIVREEGDAPCDSDRHAVAWETLYVPSTPNGADPDQAPTEIAPSTPAFVEGETPSIPETPHYHPDRETFLQKNQQCELLRALKQRSG